jgi:hypothetical protein
MGVHVSVRILDSIIGRPIGPVGDAMMSSFLKLAPGAL